MVHGCGLPAPRQGQAGSKEQASKCSGISSHYTPTSPLSMNAETTRSRKGGGKSQRRAPINHSGLQGRLLRKEQINGSSDRMGSSLRMDTAITLFCMLFLQAI